MGRDRLPRCPGQRPDHHPGRNQTALFAWAERNLDKYPDLKWMYAIPNGGHRHVSVAVKLKAEGVKAGVPDVCLPAARRGCHGLYLEMKVGDNKPTVGQEAYIDYLKSAGYCVHVCYSAVDARKAIEWYLG